MVLLGWAGCGGAVWRRGAVWRHPDCSASRLCRKRLHINPMPTYMLEIFIFHVQAVNKRNPICVGPGLELKGRSRSKGYQVLTKS
jgi:hypothetical protein